MKITRKQYDQALKNLPKLREAEATVKAWEERIQAIVGVGEHMEVSVIRDDGSYECKPKEVPIGKTG